MKGRKRHIVTDTMGHILAITVHVANVHDTVGGVGVYDKTVELYPSIQGVCGDMGYRGTFVSHLNSSERKCDVTEKIKSQEWKITPERWIVERSFAWTAHSRRLAKDYEINTDSEIAWFTISNCHTLLKRSLRIGSKPHQVTVRSI